MLCVFFGLQNDNGEVEVVEEGSAAQNALEKSAELQTFHDALHQLQAIEEQIIDRHKSLLEVVIVKCVAVVLVAIL